MAEVWIVLLWFVVEEEDEVDVVVGFDVVLEDDCSGEFSAPGAGISISTKSKESVPASNILI